jgi:hypothetical protein
MFMTSVVVAGAVVVVGVMVDVAMLSYFLARYAPAFRTVRQGEVVLSGECCSVGILQKENTPQCCPYGEHYGARVPVTA